MNTKSFPSCSLRTSELDLTGFQTVHNETKRGDIVGVEGFPGKSKKGELSVFPKKFVVLYPCLHMPPSSHFGLKDQLGEASSSTALLVSSHAFILH